MSEEQTNGSNGDLTTKAKIVKFIDAISDEKYASANKYLQAAVDDKIEDKIRQAAEQPIFK
tara:strand:+ start:329 stop:511 length:183 start_codon:yes stop_codon:yes gene_type:complete